MRTVSVRELKKNPSAVLRDARTEPVVVLKRHKPEAVLVHLSDDSLLDEPGIRAAIATALFRSRSLSLGRAAEIAGMPIAEFMRHASSHGIPVVDGDADTVRADMEAIAQWIEELAPTPDP